MSRLPLRFHLIGGGISAGQVDPASLEGFTIGLNEAGILKPCDFWFSLDHNYAREVMPRVLRAYKPTAVHVCCRPIFNGQFPGINIWQRQFASEPIVAGPHFGRWLSDGGVHRAGCTGWTAINLAAQMRAEEIYLHGFDFHQDYRYWYAPDEAYPRIEVPAVVRMFNKVAAWYALRGIRVVNCNPDSSITGFEYGTAPSVHHHKPASGKSRPRVETGLRPGARA